MIDAASSMTGTVKIRTTKIGLIGRRMDWFVGSGLKIIDEWNKKDEHKQ